MFPKKIDDSNKSCHGNESVASSRCFQRKESISWSSLSPGIHWSHWKCTLKVRQTACKQVRLTLGPTVFSWQKVISPNSTSFNQQIKQVNHFLFWCLYSLQAMQHEDYNAQFLLWCLVYVHAEGQVHKGVQDGVQRTPTGRHPGVSHTLAIPGWTTQYIMYICSQFSLIYNPYLHPLYPTVHPQSPRLKIKQKSLVLWPPGLALVLVKGLLKEKDQ